ncbi:hypothetical protein NG798_24795 [Ancylothrix sp. C2]|uniref:hypothetical protein n=1 Tax=Ancylothrix sp. D3o TaxID=2953691 RepID=UPI0021BAD408|nr:hypothetical protein [Ancylothrix sp. D3o]MCT7953021.1 hypothetical protein [Ancylothrix sp. D3o]
MSYFIAFFAQTSGGMPVVEAWVHPEIQEQESVNGLLLLKGLAIINQTTIDFCLNRSVVEGEAKDLDINKPLNPKVGTSYS